MSISVDMKAADSSLKRQSKSGEKEGRKATGPRFLRDNQDDFPKDPKIAGLPSSVAAREGPKWFIIEN